LMKGYVQLLRVRNCLMAVASVLIVALIAAELDWGGIPWFPVMIACAVVFLFMGGGNSLNDYLDRDIDRRVHRRRPIPRGLVRPKSALAFSGGLFVLSVILALWLHYYALIIVLVNLVIMLAYEFKAKSSGLAGNLMISWLTGSIFLFGAMVLYEDFPGILDLVLILLLLSFFATLGREITKDIQDVKGDIGRTTLPMKIGRRKAGYAAIACFGLAIVFSPLPFTFGTFGWLYLLIVIAADAIFIYAAVSLKKSPRRASGGAKMAMLVALAAFLLGGLI
jgi:geranylgeranylglycerol-phosphate geranylgeranyltransferase